MNTPRICIICRESKTSFSREHIFPEAIGGDWVIHSVCAECNTWLGKCIDAPFISSPSISLEKYYRKISRGRRRNKSPFAKKIFPGPDGKKYVVGLTNNGEPQAQILPHSEIDYSSGIPIGIISFPLEWVTKNPEGLERYKENFIADFERKTGRKFERTSEEVTQSAVPVQVTLCEKGNDIIFGCLKIAYEATVTILPQYLEDPLALVYSTMLKSAEPDRRFVSYFNPDAGFIDSVRKLLICFPVTGIFQMGAAIFNIPSIGLVCAVRVFGVFYPIVMSQRVDYLDNRLVILLNDSMQAKAWYMVYKGPFQTTVYFDRAILTVDQQAELADMNSQGMNHFTNELGSIPIFDQSGNQIASDATQMIALYHLTHNCPAATVTGWKIDAGDNQYFAFSGKSRTYFKIHTIIFDWTKPGSGKDEVLPDFGVE